MPQLKSLLNPAAYLRYLQRSLGTQQPVGENHRGVTFFPPGHFYSPLIDIEALGPDRTEVPFDGPEYWECVDLQTAEQKAYFQDLIDNVPTPKFPKSKTQGLRYYTDNIWFSFADAFTLSSIIQKEKPSQIVEVGSGFSSAVMLDTIHAAGLSTKVTCIEPYPERLKELLTPPDIASVRIIQKFVQDVPFSTFEELNSGDVLFIDSSHVAKVGSDVTHIFLRILPRLKPGVFIHFHDIFYPHSYPIDWIRKGWAWNESLFLRAFLTNNPNYRLLAFNSFARHTFPEIFLPDLHPFVDITGGSIWMRKV